MGQGALFQERFLVSLWKRKEDRLKSAKVAALQAVSPIEPSPEESSPPVVPVLCALRSSLISLIRFHHNRSPRSVHGKGPSPYGSGRMLTIECRL